MEPSTEDFGRQCLAQWVGDRQALIGVNLVNEMGLLDQPGLVADIALALDQLATDLDSRIVFLANEVRPDSQFDRAAALRIISLMKSKERVFLAPNQYFTPAQMMSIIACCDLTISMRYHFCMFSALQGVPFIAIERSDKVTDLCWDIGWSAAVAPSKLDPIEVIEHGRRLRQNTPGLRKQLDQCVQEMRRRAGRNAEALKTLVRHCDGVARHGTLAAS
jgi:polysaccharide pyruvyl transferase WcaK-like protein